MTDDMCPEPDPDRLRRALSKLRPLEREVLLLSSRERLSNAEIAARLGISADAVERRLVRALLRLDRILTRGARPWWRFW